MDEQWKQLLMIVLVFAAGIAVGVMLSENYAKDLAKETCGTCITNYNELVSKYNNGAFCSEWLQYEQIGIIDFNRSGGGRNATKVW